MQSQLILEIHLNLIKLNGLALIPILLCIKKISPSPENLKINIRRMLRGNKIIIAKKLREKSSILIITSFDQDLYFFRYE